MSDSDVWGDTAVDETMDATITGDDNHDDLMKKDQPSDKDGDDQEMASDEDDYIEETEIRRTTVKKTMKITEVSLKYVFEKEGWAGVRIVPTF